jgi:hypothetical protein
MATKNPPTCQEFNMKEQKRFTITAKFQDANQPDVNERCDRELDAFQTAHSFRSRFAALKSVQVDDARAGERHVAQPTPDGLVFLFTLPLPKAEIALAPKPVQS